MILFGLILFYVSNLILIKKFGFFLVLGMMVIVILLFIYLFVVF